MLDIKKLKTDFESFVKNSERVVILPHKNADFDAIGSALGLAFAVRKLKKNPIIIVDDRIKDMDNSVRQIISEAKLEFPIITSMKYLPTIGETDSFVMTDVNKSYLITISDYLNNPERVFILDHHESDKATIEALYNHIDPSVSSASEIVTKLLEELKIKIPANIANYLLAGIYLDTDKVKKNVNAEVFMTCAKLVSYGADINQVISMFSEEFESDRRVQELIARNKMQTYKYAMMVADDETYLTPTEIARAADYALSFVGVDASFAIGRIDEETAAISARSKSTINVGNIMSQMGGGGHQYSAAARLSTKEDSLAEIGLKLEKILRPSFYVKQDKSN